jgi:hypothetical protein
MVRNGCEAVYPAIGPTPLGVLGLGQWEALAWGRCFSEEDHCR